MKLMHFAITGIGNLNYQFFTRRLNRSRSPLGVLLLRTQNIPSPPKIFLFASNDQSAGHIMALIKVLLEILSITLIINVFPEVNGVGFELPGDDVSGRAGVGNWCYLKKNTCTQDDKTAMWKSGNCILKNQSPINLNPSLKKSDSPTLDLQPMTNGVDYGTMPVTIKNVGGHSIGVHKDATAGTNLPKTQIKWEGETYTLEQFHFHWGSMDDIGSEHAIGGRSFSMEVHFVHYNGGFENIGAAFKSDKKNALLVVGVFLQADSKGSSSFMDKITGKLPSIVDPEKEEKLEDLAISDLLKPLHGKDVYAYTYEGSLTTPPCNEIVQWVVVRKPILIAPTTVAEFRKVFEEVGKPLTTSYRKLQETNSRPVKLIKVTI